MRKLFTDRKLLLIFGVALVLRVLFLAIGAKVYYGANQRDIFTNGDTHSFVWAFENLWHYGRYTFDFLEPDAAFGRLPGYPFFYGLHYLIFGPERASLATACTQVVLDSCSALLIFSILQRLVPVGKGPDGRSWAPYVGAALYATYPFAIVWVSIVGTETMATFLALAWLAWLLRPARSAGHFVVLGLLLAAGFYVREYLGILVPISGLYVVFAYLRPALPLEPGSTPDHNRARSAPGLLAALLLLGGTFGALYALWPIRNYASFHRVMLIKPPTAGYANYNADFAGFRGWVMGWAPDEQKWLDQVAYSPTTEFPAAIFASSAEAAEARRGAQLAHACGSSFYLYREKIYASPRYRNVALMRANRAYQQNCNSEIKAIFDRLRASYIRRNPVRYWVNVPVQNLRKALFKSNKNAQATGAPTGGAKTLLIRGLFAYRTLLLLLGLAGAVVYWRNARLWPGVTFAAFMYLFICFLMRNLEMRYLLQADAMLLLPAALLLAGLAGRVLRGRPAPAGAGTASALAVR